MTVRPTVFLAALLMLFGCHPNLHLLVPVEFEGAIVVVFDDPTGEKIGRIVRIPESGTLFVKDEFHGGFFEVSTGADGEPVSSLDCAAGKRGGCFAFMTIGGNLNDCLADDSVQFHAITFLVAKTPTPDLYKQQEDALRSATLAWLAHRGMADAAECYRERPHDIRAYQATSVRE